MKSYKKAILGVNDAYYAGAIDGERLKEETEKLGKALPTDRLRDYATSGNVATKSQEGFKLALNKTTLAAGMTKTAIFALNAAKNALIGMGVGLAINGLISLYQKLANSQQEAIDKGNEVSDAYTKQSETVSSNIDTVKGLEKEFKELSNGVDDYGNRISLTTDEHERYQEIVSKILGISPSLTEGWNNEGKAIANKNGLIERSIALLEEERRIRLDEVTSDDALKTVFSGKKAQFSQEKMKTNFAYDRNELANLLSSIGESFKFDKSYDIAKILGFTESDGFFDQSAFSEVGNDLKLLVIENIDEVIKAVKDKRTELLTILSAGQMAEVDKIIESYSRAQSVYDQKLEQSSKALNPTLQLVPQTLTAYQEMSDAQKSFVSDYINGFRITSQTTEKDVVAMKSAILDFTQAIADNPIAQDGIDKLFTLNADKSTMSYGEWQEAANGIINSIADALGLEGDDRKDFIIKIGFKTDSLDKTIAEIDDALPRVSADELNTLTEAEIRIGYTIKDNGDMTFDEFKTEIANIQTLDQSPDLSPLSLEEANKLLDETQSKYQSLAKSIEDYNTTGIMTIDNMQAIIGLGNEYLQFLSVEDGQIKMNKEGLVQLALARIDDAEAAYLQEATNLVATLTDEKTASDFLKKSTEDEAKARLDNAEAAWEEAHALAATNAAKTGSTLLAEAIKTLEANVGNAKYVFDEARNSIGSYTDTTMGATNATNKLSDAQKELEDSLRAEGDAAIRVIDRHIKAIQDEQKASEKAIDAQINKIREEKEAFEKAIDAELKKLNERKQALEDSIKDYGSAADSVKDLVGEQMDAIDKKKDEVNEFYDDQLDALEKVNKELQDQIEREKSLEALQKAKSQKVLIYRKGQGFVEAENEGAVKEAQDNHDQLLVDQALQAEKDRLQEERDAKLEALDAEKKLWEDYQKLWEDAATAYEREQQRLIAIKILGKNWEQDILGQRTDILDKFKEEHYNQTQALQETVLTQIETLTKQKEDEAILFEERIAALEEQKAREAENYAARIEGLNVFKDSIQESLGKIGKSWEDYQNELNLEAKWEAKLFKGMAGEVEDYASRVEAAMRRAQSAKVNGGYTSNTSAETNKPTYSGGGTGKPNSMSKLATGGVVSESGWFITDEDGKKEAKVGMRSGKATLLDKGDIVFPNGSNPTDIFSMMMGVARENPIIPTRIQDAYDTMSQVINNTNVNRKEEVHLQFSGDLSFPNITEPSDAKKLINTLLDMGRESHQLSD